MTKASWFLFISCLCLSFSSSLARADRVAEGISDSEEISGFKTTIPTSYFGEGEETREQVQQFFDLYRKFYQNPKLKGSERAVERALAFYTKNKDGIPEACGGEMVGKPIKNHDWVTVVDYTKPADAQRMFFLSLKTGEVVSSPAAHGYGSNKKCPPDEVLKCGHRRKCEIPATVGNKGGSGMTSRGFYLTDGGYSSGQKTFRGGTPRYRPGEDNAIYLRGLIDDVNDNAFKRHVVLHRASYVHKDGVNPCSSSAGCPSIAPPVFEEMKEEIISSTLVYIYTVKDEKLDQPGC